MRTTRSPFSAWGKSFVSLLDKTSKTDWWFHAGGMCTLFVMAGAVTADVFMRYVLNAPITGVRELIELGLVLVVFGCLAYTQLKKEHVAIDLITRRLSQKPRSILNNVTTFLSLCLFGLLIWQTSLNFLWKIHINATTMTLGIPHAPFALVIPLACILLFILLLEDLVNGVVEGLRLSFGAYAWLLMFSVPILVVAACIAWIIQSPLLGLNPLIVGIISLVVVFALMFAEMPVAYALMLGGILFLPYTSGLKASFSMAGTALFITTGCSDWAVLALFVLMGFFVFFMGLGKDLYYAGYKWVGHLPGGLAMATVTGSTAFAAVTGDDISAVVTMGTVASPEMRRYKYADTLSAGAICTGATLGPMIPPSMGFIIFGLLTRQPIGKLFIAGIIPGLLLSFCFMATIYIWCKINPKAGPSGEKASWRERLGATRFAMPVAILFLLVIVGIYAGIFTPVEAGGVAAFGAFAISLIMRRVNWQKMVGALREAGKTAAMVLLLLAGASIYGYFIVSSGLGTALAELLFSLHVTPLGATAFMLMLYLILGCVMDSAVVLIISIPIFLPVAHALGIDLIWFGVLAIMLTNLGFITPPYGMSLFLLRGIQKGTSLADMYRGVLPFVLSNLAVAILILFFPPLATWLPNLLK